MGIRMHALRTVMLSRRTMPPERRRGCAVRTLRTSAMKFLFRWGSSSMRGSPSGAGAGEPAKVGQRLTDS